MGTTLASRRCSMRTMRRRCGLAYLLCSDAHEAEDIVGDVFVKVYRRWRRGGISDIGAYVRRAVVNETNSKLRRRYLRLREFHRRNGDGRGVRTVDADLADRDQVLRALRRVPDRQRQTIVLRYFEDLPVADIAELLGVAPGTVRSQLSRGLDRMGRLIDADVSTATIEGSTSHGGDR